jgi:ribosomal protein S18 acetylase RimI-like enzyme
MANDQSIASFVIRLATPEDIALIEELDSYSSSPTRHIHRDVDKYFGSVDPSTHEQTLIFLLEVDSQVAAKAELMIPPHDAQSAVGYIKRVITHPDYRGKSYARKLMEHIITYGRTEQHLEAIDLHVYEKNAPAIKLYETLGFALQHKELYFRLSLQ